MDVIIKPTSAVPIQGRLVGRVVIDNRIVISVKENQRVNFLDKLNKTNK